MFSKRNIMINTDSYKVTQYNQYPAGTQFVYSYLESRGGKFNGNVFFGAQMMILEHLAGQIVTQEFIDEAEAFWKAHFGQDIFNREGWEYILEYHDGRLPIRIKAVPEGTYVPTGNVLMTVENTDPACWWLTNYIETLLVQMWYPITIATNSSHCRNIILHFLEMNGDPNLIDFKLHDFGFRGVSSYETAMIGDMAHLVNFNGTDTTAGIVGANNYYDSGMCGFSIPASEHSTMTSWGKDHEKDAMENMLDQFPNGLVACVSDSFDIFHACEKIWGEELRDKIMNRDGTLVVRPDSGDPPTVVLKVMNILWEKFGGHINDKGFKVLDPHIRVIQGDGIDSEMLWNILAKLHAHHFSADNIAFGSGGGLLQKFDRDTCKFAFKCSYVEGTFGHRDVFKDPVTDHGKKSKRGRLALIKNEEGDFETIRKEDFVLHEMRDHLETVFFNGELVKRQSWDEVTKRAREHN